MGFFLEVLVGGLLWFLFRRFGRPSMVSGPTGSPYGGQGYGPQGPFGMGGSGPANPARRDEIGVTNADLARFATMLEKATIDTIEAGRMTKDLALLVGPDQPWLSTLAFIDAVDATLQKQMAMA